MQPQKTLLTSEPKSQYTQELLDRWATFETSLLTNDKTGTFTKSQMDRLFMTFLFGVNSYLSVLGQMQRDIENQEEPLEKVIAMSHNFHTDLIKLTKEL